MKKYYIYYSKGNYGGNGTGNERIFVSDTAPRKNQTGEISEHPEWLGNTNGISQTWLSEKPTYEKALQSAKYYARKYGVAVSGV